MFFSEVISSTNFTELDLPWAPIESTGRSSSCSKSLLAWGFRLTLHQANYVFIVRFSQKQRYFYGLVAFRGTPWEKVQKRVPKRSAKCNSQNEPFRAEGGIWTPLKKHEILGHPKNGPRAALGSPKGPKDAQKGAFLRYFGYLLGVPCQECKVCSRLGGSFIFEVPGYPKAAHFS